MSFLVQLNNPGCMHMHNKSADLAFQRSQGQNLPISQTRAVWELFIIEVKGESSSPVQWSSPVNSHTPYYILAAWTSSPRSSRGDIIHCNNGKSLGTRLDVSRRRRLWFEYQPIASHGFLVAFLPGTAFLVASAKARNQLIFGTYFRTARIS